MPLRRFTLLVAGAAVLLSAQQLVAQAQGSPVSPTMGSWKGIVHWRISHEAAIGQSMRHLSGTVAAAPSATRAGELRVAIKLLSNDYVGAEFLWSIAPGRCFSGSEPLIQPARLRGLPITDDGVAELEVDSPFMLQAESAYHFNVYLYGAQETNVVACAELRYERRR